MSSAIIPGHQAMRKQLRTGSAIAILVASNAHARLTIAIEVKARDKRQPGLSFSITGSMEVDMTFVKWFRKINCSTELVVAHGVYYSERTVHLK